MLRAILIATVVLAGTGVANPKGNVFNRFDRGDLVVTNPHGDLLYKREYPTMAACLHAKTAIDAQRPPKHVDPYRTSTDRSLGAICVPH